MITDALINLAYSVVSGIINLFPAGGTFPAEVHTASTAIGQYFTLLSPIIPISTVATVISLIFTIEIAIFSFKTLRWLMTYIPFVGGK